MSKKIIGAFTFNDEAHLIVMQIETMLRICDIVIALSDNPENLAYSIAKCYESDKFILLKNDKTDRFNQRDEQGDRAKLLQSAKDLGGEVYYYTDLDEIVRIEDISYMRMALNVLPIDGVLSLRRYDLWKDAYHYRLNRDNTNSDKVHNDIKSPHTTKYACNLKYALTFSKRSVPNFHAERMPRFSVPTTAFLSDRIQVIHYGYFNSDIVNSKKDFYLKNSKVSNVKWGEDMQVSTEDYIKKWGAGYYAR